MKHITVLKGPGMDSIIAAHNEPEAVWKYREQLMKEDPNGDYEVIKCSRKELAKFIDIDDIYLVPIGDNWIPSRLLHAHRELVESETYDYKAAVKALYRFVELTDRKLKDKDIDAITRVICLLNNEVDDIESGPIARDTLEEVSENLRALNWQMGID